MGLDPVGVNRRQPFSPALPCPALLRHGKGYKAREKIWRAPGGEPLNNSHSTECNTTKFRLLCVDNSQWADRASLSPPHPIAAIQTDLAALSAWLKGANSGRDVILGYSPIPQLANCRFRQTGFAQI